MDKIRPMGEVMRAVLVIIPDDVSSEKKELVKRRFASILDSYQYAAPESIGHWWGEMASVLDQLFPAPKNGLPEWQKTLSDMIADKLDYRLFLEE